MISTQAEFQQTLDQMQRIYDALQDLRRTVLPLNPRNFAILSEGPLDQIRRLQEELEEYRCSLLGDSTTAPVGRH